MQKIDRVGLLGKEEGVGQGKWRREGLWVAFGQSWCQDLALDSNPHPTWLGLALGYSDFFSADFGT